MWNVKSLLLRTLQRLKWLWPQHYFPFCFLIKRTFPVTWLTCLWAGKRHLRFEELRFKFRFSFSKKWKVELSQTQIMLLFDFSTGQTGCLQDLGLGVWTGTVARIKYWYCTFLQTTDTFCLVINISTIQDTNVNFLHLARWVGYRLKNDDTSILKVILTPTPSNTPRTSPHHRLDGLELLL